MPFLSGRRRQRRSTRTADRLNLWPSLGATAPHEFKAFGILPLDHGFMKAPARLATSAPVGNAMSLSNHADNVQVFQPPELGVNATSAKLSSSPASPWCATTSSYIASTS